MSPNPLELFSTRAIATAKAFSCKPSGEDFAVNIPMMSVGVLRKNTEAANTFPSSRALLGPCKGGGNVVNFRRGRADIDA